MTPHSMRVPRKCSPKCYETHVLPVLKKKHVSIQFRTAINYSVNILCLSLMLLKTLIDLVFKQIACLRSKLLVPSINISLLRFCVACLYKLIRFLHYLVDFHVFFMTTCDVLVYVILCINCPFH